jgi:hypothetical protein
MAEPTKDATPTRRSRHPDRERAAERPGKRTDYSAGADGTQHVNTPEEGSPDHSERAWGGDQDIDTAGMIPEEKKPDSK